MPPISKPELIELSQGSCSKGAADFIKFLLDKVEFQTKQIEKIRDIAGPLVEIPHFLNVSPKDLVDKMSWYLKI